MLGNVMSISEGDVISRYNAPDQTGLVWTLRARRLSLTSILNFDDMMSSKRREIGGKPGDGGDHAQRDDVSYAFKKARW
jgi:hypothetical protein